MTSAINRRQFLSGDVAGRRKALRPPWALSEAAFVARCTGCGDCVAACPARILLTDRAGFAAVDFSRGECDFCGACVAACPATALQRNPGDAPWHLVARIDHERCLGGGNVECRRCAEPCVSGALRVRLRIGGFSAPEIDATRCTGCGACYAVCPVQAVSLTMN